MMSVKFVAIALSLFGTLGVYYVNKAIYVKTGKKLYLQPMILCPIILATTLLVFHVSYNSYMEGASMISFMLSPATVAFAIPLYRYRGIIKEHGIRLLTIISIACLVAMSSSVGLAHLANLGHSLEMSVAPRSITTPLAIAASNSLGGNPTITAILVIVTGIVGMIVASIFIDRTKINNYVLRGLILGVTAHGTGTAKAYEHNNKTGVIASLAMIIMGVVTSVIVPLVAGLI